MARKIYLRDFSHKKSAGFRKFIGDEKVGEIVDRGNKKNELLKIFQSAIEKSGGDEGEAMSRVQRGLRENKYFANSDVRQIMDEAKKSGYFVSSRSFSSDEPNAGQPSAIRPRAAYRLKDRRADLNRNGARGISASSPGGGGSKKSPQGSGSLFRNRPQF
ncbi:MAG: hypothetical protein WC858_02115 [Parcubacteria group bacterium]|jgi:hypothetical protein